MDEHWSILAVNRAWTKAAAVYDYDLAPGANYLHYCERRGAEGHSAAAVAAGGAVDVASGSKDTFSYVYHGRDLWEGYAFQLCISRVEIHGRKFATIARYDVSELIKLRQLRENFSDVLIEGQAEERRRVARDVHDSTMQILVALDLSIGQLMRQRDPRASHDVSVGDEELIDQAQLELRSIAFLAYPPPLKELGLIDALRSLTDGYGRHTELNLSLHIHASLQDDWCSLEVVIYRVVQEALSNIHRHSNATDVWVGLIRRRGMLHAVVRDDGIGISAAYSPGVGLRSMRARLAEHGGRSIVRPASRERLSLRASRSHPDIAVWATLD